MTASTGLAGAVRHLTIGAIVEKAATFVSGLLLFRLLPLADYGALVLAYSTFAIVELFAGFAMGDLVVTRYAQRQEPVSRQPAAEARDLLGSYLLWMAFGIAGAGVAGLLLRPWITSAAPIFAPHYGLLLAAALTTPVRNLVITLLRVEHDFGGIKTADIVRSVGLAAGYMVFIGAWRWGLAGGLAAHLVANSLPLIWLSPRLARQAAGLGRHLRAAAMVRLLGDEGQWQLVRYAVTTLHGSARPWLIGGVLGLEAVALFNAAKTVLAIPGDVLPLKEALVPLMSREVKHPAVLRRMYVESMGLSVGIFGAAAVAIAIAAPWIFTAIFPRYQAAVVLIQIMSANVVIAGLATPQVALLYALRRQRAYSSTTMLNLVLMVLTGVPLMLWLGVTGFAISFVLNSLVIVLLRQRVLRKACPDLSLSWQEWMSFLRPEPAFIRQLWSRR